MVSHAQPKSKDKIVAICIRCQTNRELIFAELVRTVNLQSTVVDSYHCPSCYRSLPENVDKRKKTSLANIDKITRGASERSKALWENEEYRLKCLSNSKKLSQDQNFKDKISLAIKDKFINDQEYVEKVRRARQIYHHNKKNPQSWDLQKFIQIASEVHDNKYSYTNTIYHSFRTKVEVCCDEHGSFWVRPSHHIHYKNGCPQCNAEKTQSDGERELSSFVESIWPGEILRSNRSILNGMEIDIWIPGANLGIEYNGAWYHSTTSTASKNYHSIKSTVAHKNGINLLQFVDLDLHNKRHIAESMIKNKLGLNNRIFARNCKISQIDKPESIKFFNSNHYHGWAYYDVAYGLYFDGVLKSVLSFRIKDDIAEIARFATLSGYNVVGGFSKLMKHFIKTNNVKEIFTYVDRSFTTSENCYSKFGMSFEYITKPGYRFLKGNKLHHRMKFQKHKLANLLESYDPAKTGVDNMLSNGYRLLYDAGNLKYRIKLA